jgi:[ribosomal protein S5]-alanine N-acetyltransferase
LCVSGTSCLSRYRGCKRSAADDNHGFDHYHHTMNEPATQVPALDTARLQLRCLKIEDTTVVHRVYGDPEAMRYWDMPPSIDLKETERRLARALSVDPQWHATWTVWARRDGQLADDQFIGMVNYHARQPWNRRLALGWILIPSFQGRGYMQEAVRVVLAHCFTTLNTHRVEAEIEPENVRSARLAQRLGFQREGLLRDRLFVADQPRTQQMYGLLRSDWGG